MERNRQERVPQPLASPLILTPEQMRQLVERVVNGAAFRRSPALRAFLTYIADHAISGQGDRLKEQAIGSNVLGRKPNYDPADDNIVRVRAHELRERLEKHFATEGGEEPFLITVPKGTYVPEFLPRRAELAPEAAAVPVGDVPAEAAPRRAYRRIPAWANLAAAFLLTAIASAGVTAVVLRGNGSVPKPQAGVVRDFWGQFFPKPGSEIKIVFADTNFALWQDLSGKSLNLGNYLSHKYLDMPDDKMLEVAQRRATSPADVAISVHLAALATQFGGQATPQYARNANAEFFHRGNIILLGSHRSNPWTESYEPYLNFELEQDPATGAPRFRNRSPQANEAAFYAIPASLDTKGDEAIEFTSYGVLSLRKRCGDRGFLVLDEGLNMQATEAVGDMATDPQRLEGLLRAMDHKPGTDVAPFEALIQITSLPGGGYDNPKIAAFRILPSGSCVAN